MALARRFKVSHDEVFGDGAYLVGEVQPIYDFDRSTAENKVQQVDPETGLLLWAVEVLDADPDARKATRNVTVKIAANVQPVPPANESGTPFTLVVFEGLTATPWVDSSRCKPPEPGKAHRCRAQSAWSFRAEAMTAPKASVRSSSSSPEKAA